MWLVQVVVRGLLVIGAKVWAAFHRAPRAVDPSRSEYFPRPASYGQALPTVYGTTRVPALALSRGRLEIDGAIWRQYNLVLALCQGPATAVRAVWLTEGGEGETTGARQRIEWTRMEECGATLEVGNLTGNDATAPMLARGGVNEFLVATDGNKLRFLSHVWVDWPIAECGNPTDPEAIDHWEIWRCATQSGTYTQVGTLSGASLGTQMFYNLSGHYRDFGGSVTDWYKARWISNFDNPGTFSTPRHGTFTEAASFLPALAGATTITLGEASLASQDPNYAYYPSYGGSTLDGTYAVSSITDHEVVLTNPQTVRSVWSSLGAGANVVFRTSYYIVSGTGFSYPGIAHIRAAVLDLAKLYSTLDPATTVTPAFTAEVSGLLATSGPSGIDAEGPAAIADMVGTNYWALNAHTTVEADVGADGTADSSANRYCRAAGSYVSGAISQQRSAAEHIQGVLDAIDCTLVDSEQKLKIVPLGDEPITGNGYTYTPFATARYDLTLSDILASGDEAAVAMSALPDTSAANVISVEYRNRDAIGSPYRISIETALDGADIESQALISGGTGKREASPLVLHWIATQAHARRIAQLQLQRALSVRHTQKFRLPWRFARLEHGVDFVTLTDANAGLDHYPVRIMAIEEDTDGEIGIESVEWAEGSSLAVTYATQPPIPTQTTAADPGPAETPVVIPVPCYISGLEYAVWVAASGPGASWGGCDVYVSTDGTTYENRGAISGRSPFGTLINSLASATGLDETNNLDVDLSVSRGSPEITSSGGRDALDTLCYVDGELLAYTSVAAYGTDPYRWRLTSLRRAALGTSAGAHAAGSQFVRIDSKRVAYMTLPASAFGVPIYIKLRPFNMNGTGRPDLADVAPYQVTIPLPVPPPPTGVTLAVVSSVPDLASNQWRAAIYEKFHMRWARVQWTDGVGLAAGYEVALYTGADPDDASAYILPTQEVAANVRDAVFSVSAVSTAITISAAVRARYASGVVSAWATSSTSEAVDKNTNGIVTARDTATLLTGQVGELWPNGTSELAPSSDSDLDGPAYGSRYEAGASAWAGTWVRRVVNTKPGAGAESGLLGHPVAAVPGHTYTIEARCKATTGTGEALVIIEAYAADGTTVVARVDSSSATTASWARRYVSLLVPTNAATIKASLVARKTGAGGSFTADFDAISFYRSSTAPPTLTASVTPSTVTGSCERIGPGTCTATTSSATASGSGGVPTYTYAWEYVSGTTATINSPTSATTTFTRSALTSTFPGTSYSGLYRCKVTDHDGTEVYTSNVTVTTTHAHEVA
jgi:hypothetical protein